MFLSSQLTWDVVISAEDLDIEGLMLQRAILLRIMKKFSEKKASSDLGHFLAVTTLNNIGEGKIRPNTGELLFRVSFSCITFKIFTGEILEGTVHKVMKYGVFLSCGPVDKLYLSHSKMGDYKYVPGENHHFSKDDMSPDIQNDTILRLLVIDAKYFENENELRAVVSMDGDHLGPVKYGDGLF